MRGSTAGPPSPRRPPGRREWSHSRTACVDRHDVSAVEAGAAGNDDTGMREDEVMSVRPRFVAILSSRRVVSMRRLVSKRRWPLIAVTLGLALTLSLIHISEPTRLGMISYAVFCLK